MTRSTPGSSRLSTSSPTSTTARCTSRTRGSRRGTSTKKNRQRKLSCSSEEGRMGKAGKLPGCWPAGLLEETAAIMARHHEWPDGLDSYDAVFNSATFYPLQRRRELVKMMQL